MIQLTAEMSVYSLTILLDFLWSRIDQYYNSSNRKFQYMNLKLRLVECISIYQYFIPNIRQK
jgi:hypothetical protein